MIVKITKSTNDIILGVIEKYKIPYKVIESDDTRKTIEIDMESEELNRYMAKYQEEGKQESIHHKLIAGIIQTNSVFEMADIISTYSDYVIGFYEEHDKEDNPVCFLEYYGNEWEAFNENID